MRTRQANGAVADGTAPDLSGWRPDNAQNSFAGTTVDSIVLEISHQHPQLRPGARSGAWCATKLARRNGRTLADNAPEAMLSLVTNMAVPSGLKPAVSGHLRDGSFPYVVPA